MAEPDSEHTNAMEDEDLEDGEIETDEENEEVKPAPAPAPTKPSISEPAKKPKNIDDDSKKISDVKGKNDHRKSTTDNSAAKSKKQSASDIVAKGRRSLSLFYFSLCFLVKYSK